MHRQRHRRIASAMLFVWLLAVFASGANACLVQPAAEPASARGHHGMADAGVAHGATPVLAAGGVPHDSDPARERCADFCDAEQRVVVKPQSSKGEGAADATPILPTGLAARSAFVTGRLDLHWRPLAVPPPPGPPVAIAFLRLTL